MNRLLSAVLIAFLILAATVLVLEWTRNGDAQKRLRESQDTLAYACGFNEGHGVYKALPESAWCKPLRENAARHGFHGQ